MAALRLASCSQSLFRQNPRHSRFNVLRHLWQRRPCIRAGKFQSVILRRVVARRGIDRPIQFPPLNPVSNPCRRRKLLPTRPVNPLLLHNPHPPPPPPPPQTPRTLPAHPP